MAKKETDVLIAPSPVKAEPGAIMPRGYSELAMPDGATPPAAQTPVAPAPGNPGQ
jgi:hypothetical protein